jgi:hypothetical protein
VHPIRFDISGGFMPVASGELIRMMNYVDDIAATLRRIQASMGIVTPEERKRLAEYMTASNPIWGKVLETLEKG